jgi:hypothetical protein
MRNNYLSSKKALITLTKNHFQSKIFILYVIFSVMGYMYLPAADNSNIKKVDSYLIKSGNQGLVEISAGKGKDIIMINDPEPGEIVIPTLSTNDVTNITGLSARSGGNSINNGNGTIESKGIVWSTNPNPNIDNYEGITSNGTGTDDFTANLTNLNLNTYYYVRAYATNEAGTGYGNEVSFLTLSYYNPPTIQSSNITTWDVRNTSMSISWSNGNGDGTMVVVKTGSDFNANDIPQSGGYYDDYNTNYSAAPEVVSGSNGGRIVYYGSNNSISLTGLTAITRYRIRLFAYNGNPAGASAGFNQNTSTNNPYVQRTARFKGVFNNDGVFPESENSVSIYPTPANDFVNINITKSNECSPGIRIFDNNGKEYQIKPEIIHSNKESMMMKLSLNGFVSGIYNLVIHCDDEIIIERLMITR